MKLSKSQAALATVSYADIFSYPLTKDELKKWLIGHSTLPTLPSKELTVIHSKKQSFVVLTRRKLLINKRKKRFYWSSKKWQIAKKVSNYLKKIPTIQLIGVTGALAMNNTKKDDDIDLIFFVKDKTVWISRLFIIFIIEFLGLRRKFGDKIVNNKICLNMFMTTDILTIPESERDLFSAHEILQMHPLWDRGGIYQQFFWSNVWIKKYLPNAWKANSSQFPISNFKLKKTNTLSFKVLDPLAKILQLWYMDKKRTSEIITDSYIRFHPHDARIWVRQQLARRLRRFKIPLDKIFYLR